MVRRISTSQFRSKLRQIQQKRRQAINKYNQAVRKHNQQVKRAIDNYNREVRAYNTRVRAHRQRIQSELNRLKSQSRTTRYTIFRTSVQTLHQSYVRLESRAENQHLSDIQNYIYDLSEKENANSLEVMNSMLEDSSGTEETLNEIQDIKIADELTQISPDLDARWRGAVFSLNPQNPDAARHFCTSAREIIIRILDLKAPNEKVLELYPMCDKTQEGKPTRRSKIKHILHQKEISDGALEEFVDEDVNNIIELFRVFNDATHGGAGTFGLRQLLSIKTRVEDGILFLTELVN